MRLIGRKPTVECNFTSYFGRAVLVPYVALAWLLAGGAVQGQGIPAQREEILDEPFRLTMDETVPPAKRAVFDWGGWFRSSLWDVDDNVDRDFDGSDDGRRVLRRQQLRLWGQVSLDRVHQFYGRGRLDYLDWNSGTSYNGNDSDWHGPYLDRLWYDFRLSRLQEAYGDSPGDLDVSVRVGRQYVRLGSGLVMSTPLDAVLLGASWRDFEVSGLLALSTTQALNIDGSVPDNTKESRRYGAVQVGYSGRRDHAPFAYFLLQEDQDAGSVRLGQAFGYDSMYAGIGSIGKFFHRDLQYTVEIASESGKSYATGTVPNRQNIHAWAFDTEIRYLVQDECDSQIVVEYLLASGDSDRRFSPTDTVGGNALGTSDTSFNAWGFRDTGLVLAPQISNLGMIRLGGSTFPARTTRLFKELLVGADLFIYHKQKSEGAISDSLSTEPSSFVGSGVDLYANWRMSSDLAWTVRYGVFMPGDAFDDKTDRQQFFTGLTLNF